MHAINAYNNHRQLGRVFFLRKKCPVDNQTSNFILFLLYFEYNILCFVAKTHKKGGGFLMKTTCNVGTTDKIVRVVIGVISLWLAYAYSPWWLLLSIIMLVTAGMGWCPINKMLGINTCHIKTKHTKNDHVKEGGAQKTVTDTTSH